jgi:hypothetical protein
MKHAALSQVPLSLYCDLILSSLSEAARREFPTMDLSNISIAVSLHATTSHRAVPKGTLSL